MRASLCRCKSNFRGSGVYVPRSVDRHPALRIMVHYLASNAYINDGNQVAPLTREHPRRRYTPVDYPWGETDNWKLTELRSVPRSSSELAPRIQPAAWNTAPFIHAFIVRLKVVKSNANRLLDGCLNVCRRLPSCLSLALQSCLGFRT